MDPIKFKRQIQELKDIAHNLINCSSMNSDQREQGQDALDILQDMEDQIRIYEIDHLMEKDFLKKFPHHDT